MSLISGRRLLALCRKESYQIMRDPSSILVAFVMPILLLFIFGYAVNLDADHVRIGLLLEDQAAPAQRLAQTLNAGQAFKVYRGSTREELMHAMAHGKIRAIVIVPNDFSHHYFQAQGKARIQLLADGAEPNTAKFIASYVQGALDSWQRSAAQDKLQTARPLIEVRIRSWYNPSTVSRNFLVPGSIAVVMTIIGAMLTSLVVAREWERGTMEALLATPVTRSELLLSKIIPYYVLGIAAMLLCVLVSVWIMHVPFRGSIWDLFACTSLFLACAMGLGLFLSTVTRNQFNAAQGALTAAFLPALMLSGFLFEIASMPPILQWITHLIPARYFTNSLQTLFQAGSIDAILLPNLFFLALLSLFWLGLTALTTKRTLD